MRFQMKCNIDFKINYGSKQLNRYSIMVDGAERQPAEAPQGSHSFNVLLLMIMAPKGSQQGRRKAATGLPQQHLCFDFGFCSCFEPVAKGDYAEPEIGYPAF